MDRLKTLPLGIYEKAISNHLSWKEKLELAQESGYDYVEISVDATPERLERLYSPSCVLDLRRAVEETGVPGYTMALTANRAYPLGSEDDTVREKGLEIVERAVAFAAATGIRAVHLAAYDEHGDRCNANTQLRFKAAMNRCVEMAAGKGVILALETMDTQFMGSCTNIMALCESIDSPYLQCYADIGNLTASGISVAEDIKRAGKHIVGVHLKDSKPGVYRDVLFGQGIVDFDSCLHALEDIDYSGFFVAEMWSYDNEQFHSYLPTASSYLREKLAKY